MRCLAKEAILIDFEFKDNRIYMTDVRSKVGLFHIHSAFA